MDSQKFFQPSVPRTVLPPLPQPTAPPPPPDKSVSWVTIVLGIVIFLLVVCFMGTFIWQNQKVSNLQSQLSAANSASANKIKQLNANSSKQYLYLYNYGLKIPLSKGLQDLYYVDYVSQSSGLDTLSFSTETLASKDFGCLAEPLSNNEFLYQSTSDVSAKPAQTSVNGSPFGAVTITTSALPQNEVGSTDNDLGVQVANVNGHYIYYKAPQAACSQDNKVINLTLQQNDLFLSDLKKTEAIN